MKKGGDFSLSAVVPTTCLWLLLTSLLAQLTSSQSRICDANDLKSLKGFVSSLDSQINGWNTSFPDPDCCSWPGVICDNSTFQGRRIIGLHLVNQSLNGSLSESLADLNQLRWLNLSLNRFRGSVPPKIFSLRRLERLDLSSNALAGSVPMQFNLPAIQVINISYNKINGSQPLLNFMPRLTALDISYNSFYGPIKSAICTAAPKLQTLRFSGNTFKTKIPSGFGNCTSLRELSLDNNKLNGSLPDDIFRLSSLRFLYLEGNSLSGNLSSELANLYNLVQIDISSNQFTGFLPNVFGSLRKLKSFSAAFNNFTGPLPSSLSKLSALTVLNLRNNYLYGEISLNFSSMVRLNYLDLGSNNFSGFIPYSLSYCVELTQLNLATNNLTGEIPDGFKNLSALSFLSLSRNYLSNISSALQILQQCKNLNTVVLTRNFKNELMPSEGIRGFEKVVVLVIANGQLSGPIPEWLANCSKLKILDISWNHLYGTIPSWFGNFDYLFYIDISNNSLVGEIPYSLTKMKSLILSNLSQQGSASPEFPFLAKRNMTAKPLQYNQINSFPPSLFLSNNMLVGQITPGFGRLIRLQVLDLSKNNFSGTIPKELSDMSSLEYLDFSHNNLTGSIPPSLTKLNFLAYFSVAFNNLVGSIPTGGQFSTFTASNFEGNPGLCGFHLLPCFHHNTSSPNVREKKNRGVIVGMAFGIGIAAACLFTIIFIIISRSRAIKKEDSMKVADAGDHVEPFSTSLVLLFQNNINKELNIDDILKSTNNFDQAYIIGCGGFGLVYKATLPDGRNVAIKRLSGDFCQMEREFQAEVETLSKAQHTNLVMLQGYCRVGNDRLLIYSYMENGSLDSWLHEKNEGGTGLDWNRRLRIAKGAARGLAYLHQSCQPNILHRDIKSSNILLDGSFEAHLADFGLARLIMPYNTHVTTDLVGTLGYIPPEYGQSAVATFKGDIYSFGVVLLELLTGRRPVDMCKPKGSRDLITWVLQMKREKRDIEVFDSAIYEKEHENQMMLVLEVACLCVSESPKSRPPIQQVVSWLETIGSQGEAEK